MTTLRASVTADALGQNAVHNGALLTDLTGWAVSSDGGPDTPTLTYVAAADLPAPSPIGMGGAGKVTWTGPNTGSPFPAGLTWTSDALVAGQEVTLSLWVYVPADGSGDVRLLADGAIGDDSTLTGQWEQLTMTFSPSVASPVMAVWSSATPPTAGQSFYFTGGLLTPGTDTTFTIGGGVEGADAPILVDGSDTAITASGLAGYLPSPGDRVLVEQVGGVVEITQFLSRSSVPYATPSDLSTAYSLANAAQTSANGKNTIHYSTADPSGTPADGDVWFKFSGTIIIGQWVGSGGVWEATTIDNAVIANLDAGKITTGFLDAARIDSGTITTDKLLVGMGFNAIANPGFETGSAAPHGLTNGSTLGIVTANIRSGAYAGIVVVGTARVGGAYAYDMTWGGPTLSTLTSLPVSEGDVVYGEFWVRDNTTGGAGTACAFIDAIDSAGARVANVNGAAVTLTGSYQKVSVTYTVPAGVSFVSLNSATANVAAGVTYLVDDATLAKQVTGSLIVNGAIDGQTITGATIIGGQIETSATPTLGEQIILDHDSVYGGPRIRLLQNDTGGTQHTDGTLVAWEQGATPGFRLSGREQAIIASDADTTNATYLALSHTNPYVVLSSANAMSLTTVANGINLNPATHVQVNGALQATSDITATGGDVHGQNLWADSVPTTTSAANCRMGASGKLFQSTSLSAHKLEQRPLTADDVRPLLELTPLTWFDRGDVEENGGKTDGLRRIAGITAEDASDHMPVLTFNDIDGNLRGVEYDRIGPLLIPLLRELTERVAVLEAK